uniref:Histidine decarboxylase n=1 Tax=Aplysia californica TaxID=6500 RepID=Q86BW8_APLCA|nr:histidine decarboxylase-like [Aplysia californica]AAP34326.1 histidine decarboxylase [Aplysia californica]
MAEDLLSEQCKSSLPPGGMTVEEYRKRGKEMVDYIADYFLDIRSRRVFPDVQPGYMQALVPDRAPEEPNKWEDIFADVERVIMPGVTHWQSPRMHAYFPALTSYPSLLGDMLADAVSCLGFTWASSPACTELETIVMDWLGKMLELPESFLHGEKGSRSLGGGCIQTTASDCTFVTLLAARTDAIARYKAIHPDKDEAWINGRLIGYCSDQAHSSVEKAGLIGLVKMRFLPSDENLSLRGSTLQEAVSKDRERGFIPFYVCATLGTTGACAFDNLAEIGPVCRSEKLWLHLDAAYAGSAFICPEFRSWMAGIEFSDSFAFNPSKWLMVHFDCSAMWVKDARALHRTFNVEPLYLQHENSGAAIDYMHWQIALSRRFRALKLWFVLRSFGVSGLQRHIRRGVELAQMFENLVQADLRFEVTAPRWLGMVVFRLVGPNELTEALLKRLNKEGKVHMVPASLKGKYVIRFTVTSQFTLESDIEKDWITITDMASKILIEAGEQADESIEENDEEDDDTSEAETTQMSTNSNKEEPPTLQRVPRKNAARSNGLTNGEAHLCRPRPLPHPLPHAKTASLRRKEFGISLLLSNVPMSPKVVNGSFAALYDDNDVGLEQLAGQLSVGGEFIRLSPRKRGKLSEKDRQRSLDCSFLAYRRDNPIKMKMMGSLDSKIDDILEMGSKVAGGGDDSDGETAEGRKEKDKEEDDRREGKGKVDEEGKEVDQAEEAESNEKSFSEKNVVGAKKGRVIEVPAVTKVKVKMSNGGLVKGEGTSLEGRVLEQERWDTGHRGQKGKKSQTGQEKDTGVKNNEIAKVASAGKNSPQKRDQKSNTASENQNSVGDHKMVLKASKSSELPTKSKNSVGGSNPDAGGTGGRYMMELSKAVCSKVKEALLTLPGSGGGNSTPAAMAGDGDGDECCPCCGRELPSSLLS